MLSITLDKSSHRNPCSNLEIAVKTRAGLFCNGCNAAHTLLLIKRVRRVPIKKPLTRTTSSELCITHTRERNETFDAITIATKVVLKHVFRHLSRNASSAVVASRFESNQDTASYCRPVRGRSKQKVLASTHAPIEVQSSRACNKIKSCFHVYAQVHSIINLKNQEISSNHLKYL